MSGERLVLAELTQDARARGGRLSMGWGLGMLCMVAIGWEPAMLKYMESVGFLLTATVHKLTPNRSMNAQPQVWLKKISHAPKAVKCVF